MGMKYPQLVPASAGMKSIPNPEDLGLDRLIDRMYDGMPDDFVAGRVRHFAMGTICRHLESDPEVIRQRQELYQEMTPELVDFVFHNGIRAAQQEYVGRAQDLASYVDGLLDVLPTQGRLGQLRTAVKTVADGERMQDLRGILESIEEGPSLRIEGDLDRPSDNGYRGLRHVMVTAVYKDGTRKSDQFGYDGSHLGFSIAQQIPPQLSDKASLDMAVSPDAQISGSVSHERLNWLSSLRHMRKVTDTVTDPVTIEPDKSAVREVVESFNQKAFGRVLCTYAHEIEELAPVVTELRYMAGLAAFCKGGVMPEIGEKTIIEGMRASGEAVANDVHDGLYVVTGHKGKSSYVNDIAVTQALFQAGAPVFATYARMAPRDQILWHEGGVSDELERVVTLRDSMTPDSLVIVEDPYVGMSDGLALGSALLEGLHMVGAHAYVVTHSEELARVADRLDAGCLYASGHEIRPGVGRDDSLARGRQARLDRQGMKDVLYRRAAQEGWKINPLNNR